MNLARELTISLPSRLLALLARAPTCAADGTRADEISEEARARASKLVATISEDACLPAAASPETAPADEARRTRAQRCVLAAHATIAVMEADAALLSLLPTVVTHWAEAEGNWWSRQ